ncbi:MAG: hypothetical protein IPJ81_07610 [Chitinophagaceae bacterium]|nr:hypothetical protein [Chitinophagaceae bacterium]
MAIPSRFAEAATRTSIKGLTGWMINQKISFGSYKTSAINKGWTTGSSRILNQVYSELLNIGMRQSTENTDGRYSFILNNGAKAAEIFCQTNLSSEQTDFIIKRKWATTISNIEKVDYAFSATIVPLTSTDQESWQLLVTKNYDASKDTTRKVKIFNIPVAIEEGVATNGKESITIRPIRINKITKKNGKESKLPFKIRSGYELRMDDGVVCIINTYDNELWMYNDLDENTTFILASIASALMLTP